MFELPLNILLLRLDLLYIRLPAIHLPLHKLVERSIGIIRQLLISALLRNLAL